MLSRSDSSPRAKWNPMLSLRRDWPLYLMMLPGIIYYILFVYTPMYGVTIAFRDYSIYSGFSDAPFVGLKHFESLFAKSGFIRALNNNIIISMMKLLIGFPAPIILTLLINEVRGKRYKKFVQTSIILPNFVSWIVINGLLFAMFSSTNGAIPGLIRALGYKGQIHNILSDKNLFRWVIAFTDMWKNAGIGTIVYLAAVAGIDQSLYESAMMDGAGRWAQTWHVTLPGIRSTILIMLILRVGNIMDAGFDQIFAMSNSIVKSVCDIIDTYVYDLGLTKRNYSVATAAGLFKSTIGLVLVCTTNVIARRIDPESGIL